MDIKDILEKRKGDRSWGDLAAELKISRQTLYNILNGKQEPGKDLLRLLGYKIKYVRD